MIYKEKEEITKITIHINSERAKAYKILAAKIGCSISTLYDRAVYNFYKDIKDKMPKCT